MRVLHLITGLSTGGAQRALHNLLEGGLGHKYDSAVLSLQDEGSMGSRIRELQVPVHQLHMRRNIPTLGTVMRLRQIVRQLQPDVIQGWMYHGNLSACLAAHLAPNNPSVVWNIRHSLYDLKAEKPLTRHVIRANRLLSANPQGIIYNSSLSRIQHEAFGFQSSKASLIPNGFDLQQLQAKQETGAAVRHELSLPLNAIVIGHVARFHPMKDHASFLKAAVRVAQEHPLVRILLVGREVSLQNPALAGIVPPRLVDRFVFMGERNDAHRLIQAMDSFCLSSWSEAFPNVLGEAMACGIPCVTTDVGDSGDIVQDTGMIVPASDTDSLAVALETMIRKSPQERRTLGRAARARVENHYSLDAVVERYSDLYETLPKRRTR